jgi:alkylation response protein AidB-like acyl-CoA dehydrogenase
MIFSYALTEPRIGSDVKHIETTAILDDSGEFYILNGQKSNYTTKTPGNMLPSSAVTSGAKKRIAGSNHDASRWIAR